MLKKRLCACIIFAISLGFCSVSAADSSFTVDGNKYIVTGYDRVKLVKGRNISDVVIPSKVKNNKKSYYVTGVGKAAYKGCSKVKKLVIGRYVKSIEDEVFAGLSQLKTVKGGKNLARIGSKAFMGTSGLSSFKVGKAVVSVSGDAFKGSKKVPSKIKTTNMKIYKPLLNAIVTDHRAGFVNNDGDAWTLKFSSEAGKKVRGLSFSGAIKDNDIKLSDLGYAFIDIDSNGTSELVIKDKKGQIYNIYSFVDGKYVMLENYNPYYHDISVNKNKNIYSHSYVGAQCFNHVEYKIRGNGKDLYGVKAVCTLGSGVERTFDYGYGTGKSFASNGTEPDWDKMKGISQAQYRTEVNKMSAPYSLPFKPLVK